MGLKRLKTCRHSTLKADCASCRALQRKWYGKLKASGFVDIEYGLENPRFLTHVPDPTAPGSEQTQSYYEGVWQVFHAWTSSGRSHRDCRVAELYAGQVNGTGTVRGISRALVGENLRPSSVWSVKRTLKEITKAVQALHQDTPTDSTVYVEKRHKAA